MRLQSLFTTILHKHCSIILLSTALAMGACMSEEKFDTRGGDRLTFSTDTLRMDTVLAGIGTPTRSFMIYNRNHNGVSITNVGFLGGVQSGFRVNVDGIYITNGGLSQSIDCRGDDSLRVFVELTPEAFETDEPVEQEAHLVFTLANGVSQRVVLTAYSQNIVMLRCMCFKTDTTLAAHRPYLVYDSLYVGPDATLTLAAGTRLYFHNDAGMRIDGKLIAIGTLQEQIIFRGDRTDNMFEGQPYDRVPNQWQGLHFTEGSYGNVLTYCDIHSGSYGLRCDSSDVTLEKLQLTNSVIHNVGGDCLSLFSTKAVVANCQLTNAAGNCVTLYGGDADFVHCTIANFYPFGMQRGAALFFSNARGGTPYPLVLARFRNCIITGYNDDEVFGEQSTDHPDTPFNYLFSHCLLDTPEVSDDDGFQACAWDSRKNEVWHEKNFPAFNHAALIYAFPLVEKSAARGLGDVAVTAALCPTDRLGRPRLSDGLSDAGCYEYVGTTE